MQTGAGCCSWGLIGRGVGLRLGCGGLGSALASIAQDKGSSGQGGEEGRIDYDVQDEVGMPEVDIEDADGNAEEVAQGGCDSDCDCQSLPVCAGECEAKEIESGGSKKGADEAGDQVGIDSVYVDETILRFEKQLCCGPEQVRDRDCAEDAGVRDKDAHRGAGLELLVSADIGWMAMWLVTAALGARGTGRQAGERVATFTAGVLYAPDDRGWNGFEAGKRRKDEGDTQDVQHHARHGVMSGRGAMGLSCAIPDIGGVAMLRLGD